MRARLVLSVLLLLAALTVGGFPAYATAVIELSDGSSTVTLQDNGSSTCSGACTGWLTSSDTVMAVGAVSLTTTFDSYVVTVTTGITKPILGSAAAPDMDLNVSATRGAAVGSNTLTIEFSDTDFTRPVPGLTLTAGGTSVGSGSYAAYYSTANTQLTLGTLIASQAFGAGPYTVNTGGAGPLGTGLFSLTQVVTETFPGGAAMTFSGDHTLTGVPEPASAALLGGVLLVVTRVIRRTTRRA